jgi:hypothetical protein
MSAINVEQELKLIVSSQTEKTEAGLKRVRDNIIQLRAPANQLSESFARASAALDVRPMIQVEEEISRLKKHFLTLYESQKLSQKEVSRAAANLQSKIAALRGEQSLQSAVQKKVTEAQERNIAATTALKSRVTALIGAYIGWRTVTSIIGGITTATKNAELGQFNLAASVAAANREFQNTGTLEEWQKKVKEMSAALRVYSETDIANAASRTLDMTKRLGLSAAQMEVLIQRSADLGAGKTDLQGAIERVTAALRGEAESSEYLGLTLNETYVAAWNAAHNAQSRAWKDLTDLEKAQARYQVFLEQSAAMQGRAAASAKTLGGAWNEVKASVENAVANNQPLKQSLTDLAATIRENADSLGEMADAIASSIAVTVELISKNKDLILGLVGAGGLYYASKLTASGVLALQNAFTLLDGVNIASTAADVAGGITTATAGTAAARANIIGLAVAVAAFTGYELVQLVKEYREWSKAADEAAAAQKRLYENTTNVMQRFAGAKDFQLPGIAGADTSQLESYRNELAKTKAYWTALQNELATKADADNDLSELSADAAEAAMKLPEVTQRLQEVQAQLDRVNSALGVTGQAAQTSAQSAAAAAGLWELAAANAAEKQEILTAALAAQAETEENLTGKVTQLGEAYYQAALAAKEAESAGGEAHQKALDKQLKAEAAYVSAVQKLHEYQWKQTAEGYSDQEEQLRQSLDTQLIDLENKLQLDIITQAEFNHKKAQMEEDLARDISQMRSEAADKAAEIYGKDSAEYRAAVREKIAAEHALQRAEAATRTQWREMMGLTKGNKEAADDLSKSLDAVGEAGERAGAQAAEGMKRLKRATADAAGSVDALNSKSEEGSLSSETGHITFAFGKAWANITKKVNELKNWAELKQFSQAGFESQQRALTGMAMGATLSRHLEAEILRRSQELQMAAATQAQALSDQTRQTATQSYLSNLPGPRGVAKTVQVQFKAPNGQSVTGHFADSDADRLLDVLKQSGAVTG